MAGTIINGAPAEQSRRSVSTSAMPDLRRSTAPGESSAANRKHSTSAIPAETARHQLSGHVSDVLHVMEDKGYILWIAPKGTCDVVFKYGQTGYDFYLHCDPQFFGVEIYEVTGVKPRLVYNGVDDLRPASENLRLGSAKLSQDQVFQFRSHNGAVRLRLCTLPEKEKVQEGSINAFKLNFTAAL